MSRILIKTNLKNIPYSSGVYFFKDENGHFLYIGKASNLKNRVSSYKKTADPRIQKMLKFASQIDWQETDSEVEALILESLLIKKHQPKFNIMLRDDKQYFYVVFTKEEFPKIFITHQPKKIQNVKLKAQNNNSKLKIKRLLITNYLPTGQAGSLPTSFIGPFTDGTALKTALRLLRRIFPYCTCKQKHNNFCLNYHIGNCPGFCCLKNTEPRIRNYELGIREYKKNIKTIRTILSSKKPFIVKQLRGEMTDLANKNKFEQAAKLRDQIIKLEHVFENAYIIHNSKFRIQNSEDNENSNAVIEKLAKELKISTPPTRIESYDISNIQGEFAVGAMVVFSEGKPDKNQYRKFKIKTVIGANDTAMLEEMLRRRFNHPEWPMPDLIIVDGGKGQLNTAETVILNLKFKILKNIQIIALTKNEKHKGSHIYMAKSKIKNQKLKLSNLSPATRNLILNIDSEAHRFAISYYRKLHKKSL